MYDKLEKRIDNLVSGLSSDVDRLVKQAIDRTVAKVADAVIAGGGSETTRNVRALRGVAKILRAEMEKLGIGKLVEDFGGSFIGGLPLFEEIATDIAAEAGIALSIDWRAADMAYFQQKALTLESSLELALDSVATAAARRAMFSVGNLSLSGLTEVLISGAKMPISQAIGLADTSQSVFFRTITARGSELIEKELDVDIGYVLDGPLDKLTRPFCLAHIEGTKRSPYTREQIDKLDNGQLPDPFVTCGGWICRHQWRMVMKRRGKK